MNLFIKIKLALLAMCLLLNLTLVKGQVQGTASYEITISDKELGLTKVSRMLYFKGNKVLEIPIKANISSRQLDASSEIVVIKNKKKLFVFKDLSAKKIMLSDQLDRVHYLINDSLHNFNWRITSERKKIKDFLCVKAITKFRGRNYEAWYTESIPLQIGPWKFGGLPGMILKVADDENKFLYELKAINLQAKFDEKMIAIPKEYAKDRPISHKQFMALYKKKLEDYAKLSKVVHTGKDGSYGTVSIILPEKIEKY